ncbi:MAG TPA: hypothetical protein VKY85_24365 [Candidatus Angelobacter sp.]|nr:hypothetical protein [Candidatus Angelobacter sp.]
MPAKLWNWRLWAGFALSLVALLGYAFIVASTGALAVFWPSLVLFLIAAVLLVSGFTRSRREPQTYRGRIAGPVLAGLSILFLGLFSFASYLVFKNFPAANNAPKVGQRAPEFTLVDSSGKNFSLSQLLSTPIGSSTGAARMPKGVLVVFYRGYW